MKRVLSCVLCFTLMFSLPMISASAGNPSKRPVISVLLNGKSAKISIKRVKGAKKYQIFMKTSGGRWKKIKTTTAQHYTKSSLNSGKTYYVRVRVSYKNGNVGKYSSTKKVTVKSHPSSSGSSSSNSQTVYITDTGEKYHRLGCSSLSKSKHAISLSDACAKGYTPCARCKP